VDEEEVGVVPERVPEGLGPAGIAEQCLEVLETDEADDTLVTLPPDTALQPAFERNEHGGRNVHYGVREHAMGAIVNGLVLNGLRALPLSMPPS